MVNSLETPWKTTEVHEDDEEDDRTGGKRDLAVGGEKEEHTVTLQLPPSSLLHPTAVVHLMTRMRRHEARWIVQLTKRTRTALLSSIIPAPSYYRVSASTVLFPVAGFKKETYR